MWISVFPPEHVSGAEAAIPGWVGGPFLLRGELSGGPPGTPTPPPEWGRGAPAPVQEQLPEKPGATFSPSGLHVVGLRTPPRERPIPAQGRLASCPCRLQPPRIGQGAGVQQVPPLCPPDAASPAPKACYPPPQGAASCLRASRTEPGEPWLQPGSGPGNSARGWNGRVLQLLSGSPVTYGTRISVTTIFSFPNT